MFESIANEALGEIGDRSGAEKKLLRFGIDFLDHAFRGIMEDDLILLGAPSGQGKTQLCCNIALANVFSGKKVHYIALEASKFEITRRLKYQIIAKKYFQDSQRPTLVTKLNFVDWRLGRFMEPLKKYEAEANKEIGETLKNLFIFSKKNKFSLVEMIESVLYCSNETDLIIIDHVHYFDFEDKYLNENASIKQIAVAARDLVLSERVPIILVAHLRKRNFANEELVPGQEEFHGSSDLFKIATRVLTMSPGPVTSEGNYETYFRIGKDRLDGANIRFIGKAIFNPRKGHYEEGRYELGWANSTRKEGFKSLDRSLWPHWARGRLSGLGGDSYRNIQS